MDYLVSPQGGGWHSTVLIAMLNARRYYGLETIPVGGSDWKTVVEYFKCKKDEINPTYFGRVAKTFGMDIHNISNKWNALVCHSPIMLRVNSPILGKDVMVLVIKAESKMPPLSEKKITIVNYKGSIGPKIQLVNYEDIMLLPGVRWPEAAWHFTVDKNLELCQCKGLVSATRS